MTFSLYNRFRDLEKVRVDSAAQEGFLGATSSDGVLRTSSPLSYTDGGDYITLGFTASSVKLDDLGTPDDNTDLDFSTTLHGLVPKGTNVGDFLKDDGTWSSVAAGADVKVGIDVAATAGFLGAAFSDGVLRVTQNELTYTDGGNFVTLGLADHATARTALGLAIGTDVLAEKTIGIADDNLVEIDDAGAADDEYCRFTANGIEGRTNANVLSDIGAAAASHAMSTHSDEDSYNLATSGSITSSGTGGVTSGSAANAGSVVVYDGSDHKQTISTGSLAADITFILPTTDGDANDFLQTAGNGTLTWAASAGAAHAILDGSTHNDSVADAVTRGSIIYGNATPKWDELVVGAADTFLGTDGTDLSYRTAAQVLASLSGEAAAAFAWNSQNLSGIGTVGCGAITVADGSGISLQEAVTFTGATTENKIIIPDTLAVALDFLEGANSYLKFVTTNGSEAVTIGKALNVSGTTTIAAALTGLIRADSGVLSVDTDVTDLVTAATTSAQGKVELTIASEVNTGTSTALAVTPDSLAGSYAGTKVVVVKVIDDGTALTTGDAKTHWTVPIELNGMDLVTVGAHVYTASSSGLPSFQLHNLTDTSDMLSTNITIDANEIDSKDATTAAVIDTGEDDVVTGDVIRFDCDVAGTGCAGMEIRMGWRLP